MANTEVLNAALGIFWEKGYTATSMTDLCTATGLNPGSIYHGFGNKQGLFLQVLDHYINEVVDERIENILNQGEPLHGIEAFFLTTFEGLAKSDLIGCLLTNTSMDAGSMEEAINTAVRNGIVRIERAFKSRLTQARDAKAIPSDADVSALAVHLTSCFQGLGVIGRVTRDKKRLRTITKGALLALSK
jgi:TetR/AcrR family transcriptional repressor of nem operon